MQVKRGTPGRERENNEVRTKQCVSIRRQYLHRIDSHEIIVEWNVRDCSNVWNHRCSSRDARNVSLHRLPQYFWPHLFVALQTVVRALSHFVIHISVSQQCFLSHVIQSSPQSMKVTRLSPGPLSLMWMTLLLAACIHTVTAQCRPG